MLLMQALQATGRHAEALRRCSQFRSRLADETGLEPSAELLALERSVLERDPLAASAGRPLRGYTIHQMIGEGAHGRVYAATQPGTERRVAIKVIRPELADSSEFVRRFEAEAQLVARLEHPHIAPLYDFWREPGGAYLVFRLLNGGTAREAVIAGGPWSLARVSRARRGGGRRPGRRPRRRGDPQRREGGQRAARRRRRRLPERLRDRRRGWRFRRSSGATWPASPGCCGSCSPARRHPRVVPARR